MKGAEGSPSPGSVAISYKALMTKEGVEQSMMNPTAIGEFGFSIVGQGKGTGADTYELVGNRVLL